MAGQWNVTQNRDTTQLLHYYFPIFIAILCIAQLFTFNCSSNGLFSKIDKTTVLVCRRPETATGPQELDSKPKPYEFGYEIQDKDGNMQHRHEKSDANGVRKGSYGFIDAAGVYRKVNYIADHNGFRVQLQSNERGMGQVAPADVSMGKDPIPIPSSTNSGADHHKPGISPYGDRYPSGIVGGSLYTRPYGPDGPPGSNSHGGPPPDGYFDDNTPFNRHYYVSPGFPGSDGHAGPDDSFWPPDHPLKNDLKDIPLQDEDGPPPPPPPPHKENDRYPPPHSHHDSHSHPHHESHPPPHPHHDSHPPPHSHHDSHPSPHSHHESHPPPHSHHHSHPPPPPPHPDERSKERYYVDEPHPTTATYEDNYTPKYGGGGVYGSRYEPYKASVEKPYPTVYQPPPPRINVPPPKHTSEVYHQQPTHHKTYPDHVGGPYTPNPYIDKYTTDKYNEVRHYEPTKAPRIASQFHLSPPQPQQYHPKPHAHPAQQQPSYAPHASHASHGPPYEYGPPSKPRLEPIVSAGPVVTYAPSPNYYNSSPPPTRAPIVYHSPAPIHPPAPPPVDYHRHDHQHEPPRPVFHGASSHAYGSQPRVPPYIKSSVTYEPEGRPPKSYNDIDYIDHNGRHKAGYPPPPEHEHGPLAPPPPHHPRNHVIDRRPFIPPYDLPKTVLNYPASGKFNTFIPSYGPDAARMYRDVSDKMEPPSHYGGHTAGLVSEIPHAIDSEDGSDQRYNPFVNPDSDHDFSLHPGPGPSEYSDDTIRNFKKGIHQLVPGLSRNRENQPSVTYGRHAPVVPKLSFPPSEQPNTTPQPPSTLPVPITVPILMPTLVSHEGDDRYASGASNYAARLPVAQSPIEMAKPRSLLDDDIDRVLGLEKRLRLVDSEKHSSGRKHSKLSLLLVDAKKLVNVNSTSYSDSGGDDSGGRSNTPEGHLTATTTELTPTTVIMNGHSVAYDPYVLPFYVDKRKRK